MLVVALVEAVVLTPCLTNVNAVDLNNISILLHSE